MKVLPKEIQVSILLVNIYLLNLRNDHLAIVSLIEKN